MKIIVNSQKRSVSVFPWLLAGLTIGLLVWNAAFHLGIPWIWVFAPVWIPAAIVGAVLALLIIIMLMAFIGYLIGVLLVARAIRRG